MRHLRWNGHPKIDFFADHDFADCWYTTRPLGHNILTKTIARLCASAGIEASRQIIHYVPLRQQGCIKVESMNN